jgi:phosphatidylinositol 4-kinase
VLTPNYLDAVQDTKLALSTLEYRIFYDKNIPIEIPRNVLRRAATLLCSSDEIQPSFISHLVNIPFQIFTRESIKMGVSLWLGVIHENPRTEPRILTDVALAWERTIHRKLGIFDPKFK